MFTSESAYADPYRLDACPVCTTPRRGCTCAGAPSVVPFDPANAEEASPTMPVRLYDVVINGHKTQMNLNDADAKRLGATPVTGATADKTKAPTKARRTTPNKARTEDVVTTADGE
jgi:hypothetical protein